MNDEDLHTLIRNTIHRHLHKTDEQNGCCDDAAKDVLVAVGVNVDAEIGNLQALLAEANARADGPRCRQAEAVIAEIAQFLGMIKDTGTIPGFPIDDQRQIRDAVKRVEYGRREALDEVDHLRGLVRIHEINKNGYGGETHHQEHHAREKVLEERVNLMRDALEAFLNNEGDDFEAVGKRCEAALAAADALT